MKRSIELSGKSRSTLTNYARCLATLVLHFNCSPLDLDEEQILDYLHFLQSQKKTPSDSYFKHTLYGLRFICKIYGKQQLLVQLPSLKRPKKLPVVLSVNEIKKLINTPKLLKHRMLIALMYGCGLRRYELLNIRIEDVDLDRKMLHIRQGKDRKDRYVPLGDNLQYALQKYLAVIKPHIWLFNGNGPNGTLQRFSENGVRWIIAETRKRSGIKKHVTSHILRHTYATHLLEMGTDIITLKDLLGHSNIQTTMIYLHVGNINKSKAFSPMDKIYKINK
jgi:site-specific recombinase XerD